MDQETWDRLKSRIYFPNAVHDDRYTWTEVDPAEWARQDHTPEEDAVHVTSEINGSVVWADLQPRYRITGCAHKYVESDTGVCGLCGETVNK